MNAWMVIFLPLIVVAAILLTGFVTARSERARCTYLTLLVLGVLAVAVTSAAVLG